MTWITDSLILRIKLKKKKTVWEISISIDECWWYVGYRATNTLYSHCTVFCDWHTRKSNLIIVFVLSFLSQMLTHWNCFMIIFVFVRFFFSCFVCCRPMLIVRQSTVQNEYLEAFILQFHWIPTIFRVIHANESFLTLDNFTSTSPNFCYCCCCCWYFFRISQRKGLCFAKNKIFRHIIRQLCFYSKLLNYIMIWTI